ncbi:MAG: 2-succinyl-5-enolpyruvyl-6-hydroxy-3-cyclohexene-1-carboxylic-acid synthase [Flavobacteriales bacterium]|nr:2-succinyl-5-enolpyruvyl-6-hydroxy-3-cyclohexene-1-carboxylic-acid synthase [Flavobacteriales bacterium]
MQRAVNSLVGQLAGAGVQQAVICPGSRNAPLIISLVRHPEIVTHSLIDERAAAYTALGMAVESGKPVAIVCTSGTAVLNLYPAICEAYYSQVPLIIITADRPPELIDQWDGQCIRQHSIFEKHILGSFHFDVTKTDASALEAIQLSMHPVSGPVHINVPLAEPLYEAKNEIFEYPVSVPEIVYQQNTYPEHDFEAYKKYSRVLLFFGADRNGDDYRALLQKFKDQQNCVLLADIISGVSSSTSVLHWDLILNFSDQDELKKLKPELLITFGKFTVSKGLKQFLRKVKCDKHLHVTHNHTIADPFFTSPQEVFMDETTFLEKFLRVFQKEDRNYWELWQNYATYFKEKLDVLISEADFNEFSVTSKLLSQMPDDCVLHLGNSMPVRLVSYMVGAKTNISFYGNRGTSGIDGSTSTAVGYSILSKKKVFLLTGDVSFFYDLNGLWNQELKPNLKIIVLNNMGGGIFRLLEGPGDLPELEDYFATSTLSGNSRSCKRMADEFGFGYHFANDFESLERAFLEISTQSTKPEILEISVHSENSRNFLDKLKQMLKT